jgi:periplasmic protein TonB
MERPEHIVSNRLSSEHLGPRRFSGLIIVAAIHAGFIALLILGIVTKIELKKEDLQATVDQQKVPPKTPPPPPPKFEKPPPPFVPPPEFNIQNEAPPPRAIVASPAPPPPAPPPRAAPPAPPAAPPAPAEPIVATHTKPPYPPISQRLGEHGVTLLNVSIDASGRATDATVVTSSGSARLDAAAVEYVKQRYRWKPATRDGKPVATTQALRIVWSLTDAQ